MEKQMIILLLLLSLLLATKGTNFADEWTPVRQPIRDKLASAARHFLGLPYRWGGMSRRRASRSRMRMSWTRAWPFSIREISDWL